MRYEVTVALAYLANREPMPVDARDSLARAILADALDRAAHLRVTDVAVINLPDNTAVVSAMVSPVLQSLRTSPIDAVRWFDDCLARALYRTGLLEECDHARRTLKVEPAAR